MRNIFPAPNSELILAISLGSSTGKPSSSTVTSLAQRTANNGAIEASVIWKQGSFYYLFTSWDLCCQGTSSTYNIRVGRSSRYLHHRRVCLKDIDSFHDSVTGPFVDQAGVALTSGGGTLVLASHGSVSSNCRSHSATKVNSHGSLHHLDHWSRRSGHHD